MINETSSFIDHGIPVQAEEARTAAFCMQGEECRFVIAAKGFVLIIDPEKGGFSQVSFPDSNNEYPFASFSSNGLFYTGAGNVLLVLDPFLETFVFHTPIDNGEEIVGFSFTEDNDGQIYFTSYPHCHLLRYSPRVNEIIDYGSMDPTEKYPGTIAIDREGWVYLGIGTERKNIVAFHPKNGKKKNLVPENERQKGVGYVYSGTDGSVYGHLEANDFKEAVTFTSNLLFSRGCIAGSLESAMSRYTGGGFQKIHRNLESTYQVASYSLTEGYVDFFRKETGAEKRITFKYDSYGANLSTIVLGPDGHLYGSSMHPLQFFRYDFTEDKITNFGGDVIEKGGGGNIAAYASQGNVLMGAAYAGGKLYRVDTQKPFVRSENPRLILQTEEIHRPRCAVALSDGIHIVWGGFPGYGMVGGGLGIFNIQTEQHTLLTHDRVISNQSTICLVELNSDYIVGGTSIETPGGASSSEKEACLYLFNWKKKVVEDVFVPVAGAREIVQQYMDRFHRVHGLTDSSQYFICDPCTRKVLFKKDLSQWGCVVRNGLAFNQGTSSLLILLSNALLSVKIGEGEFSDPMVMVRLPMEASSGMVFREGRIYFGSGSRLCSIHAEFPITLDSLD
ncbi:ligand-binding sensor domain-containing protein [Falsibacillus albus]|uniref:Uncharacterized protein n=1 Tax=Falsibacillus albus TaxID=2478915 RepID=A0A3L7JYS9_9BACI|nr:hypothetical protein [Falsibacillus albus]RLQ94861.1 hypothetical protein D9X91_12810 [Falsibacillus albus]